MSFDAVISNPPYSLKWRSGKDQSINDYPLAPKSKADWQFVLQGMKSLDDEGIAVYVLPHGVLFRGAAEGKIRKRIIDENYLDAVIGLPDHLFDVTGIPVCLLVLKKKRSTTDVLFIDAKSDFTKSKNKNLLESEHINKIIDAYKARKDVDKYAHVTTLKEIQENEYNLNIPRYVDTYEPEPVVPAAEIVKELREVDAEIAKNEKELAEMMQNLVGTTPEAQAELDTLNDYFSGRVGISVDHRKDKAS